MHHLDRPNRPLPSRFLSDHEAAYDQLTYDARHELGKWLGRFSWDHFATFTFTYQPAQETALQHLKRLIRRLEQRAQGPVKWFYVLEVGGAGVRHLHVLLEGTRMLTGEAVRQAWSWGRKHVSRYDPRRGATYYVTKHVGSEVIEYDIDNAVGSDG